MKRLKVIGLHVLALPAAALLAIVSAIVAATMHPTRAVEIALQDTLFVVAHFHVTIILGSLAAIVTLVAYVCDSFNWAIAGAWAFFILHTLVALMPSPVPFEGQPSGDGFVFLVPPAHPISAYAYVGSAIACLIAAVIGLLVSAVRALQLTRAPSA